MLAVFLTLTLSACDDLVRVVMGELKRKPVMPTGEFIGTAQKIDKSEEQAQTVPATVNGTEAQAPAVVQGDEVKIEIFPPEDDVVSVGVLTFKNNSQRFYWKADGGNMQTWNLLFAKDNAVYNNIIQSFDFNGTLKETDIAIEISGTLKFVEMESSEAYYVITKRYFSPEIIPSKEAPSAKAGESLTIACKHCGKDKGQILLKLTNIKDQSKTDIPLERVEVAKDANKMIFTAPKELAKGDYTGFILRDGSFESNSISVIIL